MDTLTFFESREAAAEILAEQLSEYKQSHPLILAIPRGAVPMGRVLAERLDGDLDVVLVHKLTSPVDPEYAIGAVDESGWTYLPDNAPFDQSDPLADDMLSSARERHLAGLRKRRADYTPFMHPKDPRSRQVIVVDDGLATGSTMVAALHAVRARAPALLVCAIPVASRSGLERIAGLADKIVCLHAPAAFSCVGQFYRHFEQVGDDDVKRILAQPLHAGRPPSPP